MLRSIFLFFLIVIFQHTVIAQSFDEIHDLSKIVASDREINDGFGSAVAISGDYAVIGASGENSNGIPGAGAAYIYHRIDDTTWVELQKITAWDSDPDDHFGGVIAMDGDYIVVGVVGDDEDAAGGNTLSGAGSVYIFKKGTGGFWNGEQKIVASDRAYGDGFGNSIGIDGNFVVVGASAEDHDEMGLNTMLDAGSAYIFERGVNGVWTELQKVVASDRGAGEVFAKSIAISGISIIVGAFYEDGDENGMNPISDAGAAYIFEYDGIGVWNQTQKLVASDRATSDYLGISVAIDGSYAMVGAFRESEDANGNNSLLDAGSVYVYERDGMGVWSQVQKIVASDRDAVDHFGATLAIDSDFAIIGARYEDEDSSGMNSIPQSGSAYIFQKDQNNEWNEIRKITAPDRDTYDYFAVGVGINGDNVVVGAFTEDEDENGLNTLIDAGSAYFFHGGCTDSVVQNVTACDTFTWINGVSYTSSTNTPMHRIQGLAQCDSLVNLNLVILNSSSDVHTISACDSYIWFDGNTYTTSTSGAIWMLQNAVGCDSVLTLNLTINETPLNTVTQNGFELMADDSQANYQWIDCDSGNMPISGETDQSYLVTSNGEFGVVVMANGCVDTSECILIDNVGLDEITSSPFKIYPNPSFGAFTIEFTEPMHQVSIELITITGERIYQDYNFTGVKCGLDVSHLETGIYIIRVQLQTEEWTYKLTKR